MFFEQGWIDLNVTYQIKNAYFKNYTIQKVYFSFIVKSMPNGKDLI